jgi:hypothetical protein
LLAPGKFTNEVPRACDLDADALELNLLGGLDPRDRSARWDGPEMGFEIEIARHKASEFAGSLNAQPS